MFDTPHPAHKPPAPDRLAPSEARGVVTDEDEQRIREAYHAHLATIPFVQVLAHVDYMEFGWRCYLAATLRARESAPAVEK